MQRIRRKTCLPDDVCAYLLRHTFGPQAIINGLNTCEVAERLGTLPERRLLFETTESWRTVYEDVLQSCQTRRHLSVALIRSDDYWRDAPGEISLRCQWRPPRNGGINCCYLPRHLTHSMLSFEVAAQSQ